MGIHKLGWGSSILKAFPEWLRVTFLSLLGLCLILITIGVLLIISRIRAGGRLKGHEEAGRRRVDLAISKARNEVAVFNKSTLQLVRAITKDRSSLAFEQWERAAIASLQIALDAVMPNAGHALNAVQQVASLHSGGECAAALVLLRSAGSTEGTLHLWETDDRSQNSWPWLTQPVRENQGALDLVLGRQEVYFSQSKKAEDKEENSTERIGSKYGYELIVPLRDFTEKAMVGNSVTGFLLIKGPTKHLGNAACISAACELSWCLAELVFELDAIRCELGALGISC